MATTPWRGVFPAACTHFTPDGSLDIATTLAHLDAMLDAGIHGLVMIGTVGENSALEPAEKLEVLRQTVRHVAGRVPVLTGVAEHTTAMACRFLEAAADAGVDGAMVLPSVTYKSDQRETVHHFRAVARATPLPVMLYNNPVSYGVDLLPETLPDLMDEPTIVAIKESSDDPRRVVRIRNAIGEGRLAIFCGVDNLVMETYVVGATGWISGLVNAFPAENKLLWDLLERGDFAAARKVYGWYEPLLRLDVHPKLVQYIKLACVECGYGAETTRAPRLRIEGEERERVLKIIREGIRTRPAGR